MSVSQDLGKVSVVPKGDWSASSTYEILDIVKYQGASYIASKDVPQNTLPINTSYWIKLVDKGETGNTPNFTIGTVATLQPNEQATATITGTADNPVLNLGIPQGETSAVDPTLSVAGEAADAAATGAVKDEVINIRTAYDGTVYLSAGDAVRTQVENAEKDLYLAAENFERDITWSLGTFDHNGSLKDATNRIRTNLLEVNAPIKFWIKKGYKLNYVYYPTMVSYGIVNGTFITKSGTITPPERYVAFIVGRNDNADMSVSEAENVIIDIDGKLSNDSHVVTVKALNDILYGGDIGTADAEWMAGNLIGTGTYIPYPSVVAANNRITTRKRTPLTPLNTVSVTAGSDCRWRCIFTALPGAIEASKRYTTLNYTSDLYLAWQSGNAIIDVPTGANAVVFSIKKANDEDFTIANRPSFSAKILLKTEIEDSYADFIGKRISLLGDSITTYAGDNASTASDGHLIADGQWTYLGNHCRYPQSNLLTSVNNCYWKILIDALEMSLGVNESWAGSRVSWDGTTESSDRGANICASSQHRISHLGENGSPDIILVNAGTNDIIQSVTVGTFNTENPANYTDAQIAALSVATFADAYRAMLIRLLKTYPAAEVVCMLPNFTTSSYYSPQKQDPYLEIIKEACDYFGVKWIDARAFGISIYNLSTYLGDGVHPNAKGMTKLANDLIKKFKYDVAL